MHAEHPAKVRPTRPRTAVTRRARTSPNPSVSFQDPIVPPIPPAAPTHAAAPTDAARNSSKEFNFTAASAAEKQLYQTLIEACDNPEHEPIPVPFVMSENNSSKAFVASRGRYGTACCTGCLVLQVITTLLITVGPCMELTIVSVL